MISLVVLSQSIGWFSLKKYAIIGLDTLLMSNLLSCCWSWYLKKQIADFWERNFLLGVSELADTASHDDRRDLWLAPVLIGASIVLKVN